MTEAAWATRELGGLTYKIYTRCVPRSKRQTDAQHLDAAARSFERWKARLRAGRFDSILPERLRPTIDTEVSDSEQVVSVIRLRASAADIDETLFGGSGIYGMKDDDDDDDDDDEDCHAPPR